MPPQSPDLPRVDTHVEAAVESVQRYNPLDIVKDIPTQSTSHLHVGQERPYAVADVDLVTIDPNNLDTPLKFSSRYVLSSRLQQLDLLDQQILASTGESLADSQSLTIGFDSNDEEVFRVAPIILERWTDEAGQEFLMVADGNNRLYKYLTEVPPKSFSAIVVDRIDEKFRPVYQPVDFSDVSVVDKAPPVSQRRSFPPHFNPATYQDNRPHFGVFGSHGPRNLPSERVLGPSYRHTIEGITDVKHELAQRIRDGFIGYAPPPSEQITAPRLEQGTPEVIGFNGILQITQDLGAADFRVAFGPDSEAPFRLLVKSSEKYQASATRAVAILSRSEAAKFSDPSARPDGEFSAGPEISELINRLSLQQGCGLAEISLASSSDPDAPKVEGARIWDMAGKYYSVVVLQLSNGHEIPVVLNRSSVDEQGRPTTGAVSMISDDAGNKILGYRHRVPLGLSQAEAARMYAFSKERLIDVVGQGVVDNLVLERELTINGAGSIDSTPTSFRLYRCLSPDLGTKATVGDLLYHQKPPQLGAPGRFTPDKIHELIAGSQITDSLTVAAITMDQLLNDELHISEQFADKLVMMEEIFDPLSGPRLVVPRLPIELGDQYSPQMVDTGKSTHVEFSGQLTPKDFLRFRESHRLVPMSIEALTEMAKSGQIDYVSLAHLSVILRRCGAWKLSQ